jgi:hypothetical protein
MAELSIQDFANSIDSLPMTHLSVPENATAAKALIVNEGSRTCAAVFGAQARAIVLTGSMSRGEATLKRDGADWRVLGDATFLVVSDRTARVRIAELQRRIECNLLARRVICKIVVVTATTAELQKMKPHIYAYELRERGVVLWGDDEALHLIPPFAASDIPNEDGWWLLCNRMIEQLESAAETERLEHDDPSVRYRIAKLYLAMAACYLLTIGEYRPTYRDRAARLQTLAQGGDILPSPIPLMRFCSFVSQCTELKLEGQIVGPSDCFPRWTDAVADAEMLWRWALARILGLKPGESRADLLAAVAARQPLLARVKGWARAAYVCRSEFWRHCWRWHQLARSTSPRYLVYGAASELFFHAAKQEAITAPEFDTIVAKLPLTAVPSPLSWASVAKIIAYNFHTLLEANRS